MQYREHCLHVPTPQIRGLLTALAERAQQQVFDASDPERDAALIHCVRLAVAAEKAYDAPKKVDAKSIIQLGRRLLREAGLTIQSPRSTQRIREAFKLGRVHKEAHIALHALLPRIPLGKAWLPLNKVTLSAAAGHAIRDRMFPPQVHEWPCGSFGAYGAGRSRRCLVPPLGQRSKSPIVRVGRKFGRVNSCGTDLFSVQAEGS